MRAAEKKGIRAERYSLLRERGQEPPGADEPTLGRLQVVQQAGADQVVAQLVREPAGHGAGPGRLQPGFADRHQLHHPEETRRPRHLVKLPQLPVQALGGRGRRRSQLVRVVDDAGRADAEEVAVATVQ